MNRSVLGTNDYALAIVETVRAPLLLVDAHLRVIAVNASFCRSFGVCADEVEGASLATIGGGIWDIANLRSRLEAILPERTELRDFEVRQHGNSPEERILLLNARTLRHQDAAVHLILIAVEDVSERRRLERALQDTMAELQRSNQELEAFAAIASHDLQEPLRKIQAFGERLETACDGQLPDKGRDYLQRMLAATARMQRLINDLLRLARVTTRAAVWSAVALGDVVVEVLGDLEDTVNRSGAVIRVAALPTLAADPTQMRQLFQNLIGNALKFRRSEPPLIEISCTPAASGWRITVADNGIGFEPKHAERIFRPFERLHGRDEFDGTGIGLALCDRIVRRHGGAIRAESEPGRGTRIVLDLPSHHHLAHDSRTETAP